MEYAKLYNECLASQDHYEFVSKLYPDVKRGMTYTLTPRPHVVDPENTIHVFGTCVACGEALEASYVVGTFMLPCRHQYHPLCFAAVLRMKYMCVNTCWNTAIPSEAKDWVSRRSLLKSKWGVCVGHYMLISFELMI